MIAAIGVDTGLSAGVACLIDGTAVWVWQGPGDQLIDELTRLEHDVIRPLRVPRIIGLERFQQRPRQPGRMTAQGDAQELNGAVTRFAQMNGYELIMSGVADAKKTFPNATLVALGLRVTPSTVNRRDANDANDAMRHALMVIAQRDRATLSRMLTERGIV